MYSTWRIAELKVELKKRGASLRGRKTDLVERLESYDKNFNFGHPESSEVQDPVMIMPQNESYRDINSNSPLPPLNKTHIRHYLSCANKKMEKAVLLYESRHLLSVRSSIVGDSTFIKGYCRKTMKELQYEVDIRLDKSGSPEESHCECPAGSGTNAVCKHVAVLLLGVENMIREKIMLKHEVCTQKLQQFHVPKTQYTGTPVTAEKLPVKRQRKSVNFEPYAVKTINKENYNSRIRNLVLNFPNSTMPIKQLYEPANPYAIAVDHNYTEFDPKVDLLNKLHLRKISIIERNDIEENTRTQTESKEWFEHRRYRLTASKFHTICHLKPSSMKTYANQIIHAVKFQSRATSHGNMNEKLAMKKYSEDNDLLIELCGLFISMERPHLGASPDGLLGPDTIIEIKCPYASRFQEINSCIVPYIVEVNNVLELKSTCPYYYQIQGQLYCTGRKFCNLIIYTYKDLKVIYVNRNEAFIAQMLVKLDVFYENYFLPQVFNKLLYYNYEEMKK